MPGTITATLTTETHPVSVPPSGWLTSVHPNPKYADCRGCTTMGCTPGSLIWYESPCPSIMSMIWRDAVYSDSVGYPASVHALLDMFVNAKYAPGCCMSEPRSRARESFSWAVVHAGAPVAAVVVVGARVVGVVLVVVVVTGTPVARRVHDPFHVQVSNSPPSVPSAPA